MPLLSSGCKCAKSFDMIIFPRLQDLRARIYDPRLQVVTPNLTFAQENTLRGIHMCDIFNATSAESFRYRTENAVRLFRTTAENAYSSITIPGISSCPYGNRFYGACSTSMRPQVSLSSIYGCNVTRQNSSVYSRGFLAGVINYLNFSIDAFLTNNGTDAVSGVAICMFVLLPVRHLRIVLNLCSIMLCQHCE